jgi:phosphoribosyl-AMP cyclohydrolase
VAEFGDRLRFYNSLRKENLMGYVEETNELKLDFKKITRMIGQEVIPVAIQNVNTKEIILVAYTNEQAMLESIKLRRLVLWSTSRNELWYKGKTSGNEFELIEILVNCEQNSLVYKVRPLKGNICHTSYKGVANNCFYRRIDMESMRLVNLKEENE